MKKLLMAIVIMTALVGIANAADKMMEVTVDSVTVTVDKNGQEYVRAIITEEREMNGVSYPRSVPLMFFGSLAAEAQELSAGQAIKVIVAEREYQGRPSYTALKIVQ